MPRVFALDVAATCKALICNTVLRSRFGTVLGRPLTDQEVDAMAAIAGIASGLIRSLANFDRTAGLLRPEWLQQAHFATYTPDEPRFRGIQALIRNLPWGGPHSGGPQLGFAATTQAGGFSLPRTYISLLSGVWEPDNIARAEAMIRAVLDAFPHAQESPLFADLNRADNDRHRFENLYCGLVTWAVILVNEREFFPNADRDPEESRTLAERVLQRVGIDVRDARAAMPEVVTSRTLIGPGHGHERPIQQIMTALDAHSHLFLLEAGTSAGKTAAILRLLEMLFRAGVVDGLGMGLATRTSARFMQPRVWEVYERLFGNYAPPVILGISGDGIVDGGITNDSYRGWPTGRKERFFAGGSVVTVTDQIAQMVMRKDYAHLRAIGLSRLLVVLDESGMASIGGYHERPFIVRMVHELLSVGAYVAVMGVCMSGEYRSELLSPPGFPSTPSFETTSTVPYPLLTHRTERPTASPVLLPPNRSRADQREVDVELLHIPNVLVPSLRDPAIQIPSADFDAASHRACDIAAEGGDVAMFRNTIQDTRLQFLSLERVAEARGQSHLLFRSRNGVAAPLHSRYISEDRRDHENALQEAFGPNAQRRGGRIVVASTSFAESLDLSFSVIFTDMVPFDRLLNRAGRINRFQTDCRGRLVVLIPAPSLAAWEAEAPDWIRPSGCPVRNSLHHGLGSLICDFVSIHATWDLLATLPDGVFRTPDNNRLYTEQCLHQNGPLAERARRLGALWVSHWRWVQNYLRTHQTDGQNLIRGLTEDFDGGAASQGSMRDSGGTVIIEVQDPFATAPGNQFRRMLVSARLVLLDGVNAPTGAIIYNVTTTGGVSFLIQARGPRMSHLLAYDRTGLSRVGPVDEDADTDD